MADTFDAMTIDRPYSKGMDLPSALERLRSFVGTRYDGKVVEALIEACNEGQIRAVGTHPNSQIQNVKSEENPSSQVLKIPIGENSNQRVPNSKVA